jgi:hypothetical protein
MFPAQPEKVFFYFNVFIFNGLEPSCGDMVFECSQLKLGRGF